jgi:hypothetical protein
MSAAGRRNERGFTSVEMLVAMSIGVVVAFATLTVFEGFNRGIASSNRLTAVQDSSRRDVAKMVRILRDAGAPAPRGGDQPSTIISATANDVVFRSTSWPDESQNGPAVGAYHTQRLCLDTATKTVWFEGIRAPATTLPGTACPSTIWTERTPIARRVVNTASLPLFRIGASPVRSIGITLLAEGGTTAKSRPLELSSGGTLRGAAAPQVTAADVSVTCSFESTTRPLLSLNVAGLQLNTLATGPQATSIDAGKLLFAAGPLSSTITLVVTNVLGLTTTILKAVSC